MTQPTDQPPSFPSAGGAPGSAGPYAGPGSPSGSGVSGLPAQPPPPGVHEYPCEACGARVEFAPGTTVLRCPYCGHEQQVAAVDTVVQEHSYDAWAALPPKPVAQLGTHVLRCSKCGAQTESSDLSDRCQFCGAPLVADAGAVAQIVPEAVVPFQVDRSGARDQVRTWVRSRWFAPSRLKKVGETESLKGTYLPHWTFDASTETDYTGARGEHYWETETYTEMVDGQPQTRTREVMRTRWFPAAGHVARWFDDVLVPATQRLNPARVAALEPWSLEGALPYQPDYLAGYQTLRYDVEPDTGLGIAKDKMQRVIEQDCRSDIGGDEQQVHSMDTGYADVMFKLVLLPVWIAAYLYAGKTFQVMVNARTGEVVGERPYSAWKIAFAVLAALVVIALIAVVYAHRRH